MVRLGVTRVSFSTAKMAGMKCIINIFLFCNLFCNLNEVLIDRRDYMN